MLLATDQMGQCERAWPEGVATGGEDAEVIPEASSQEGAVHEVESPCTVFGIPGSAAKTPSRPHPPLSVPSTPESISLLLLQSISYGIIAPASPFTEEKMPLAEGTCHTAAQWDHRERGPSGLGSQPPTHRLL